MRARGARPTPDLFEDPEEIVRLPLGERGCTRPDTAHPRPGVASMSDVIIQRFGSQGSTREFPKGRFDVLELHGVSVGRASYKPGWKWSTHVGAASG